MAKPPDKTMTMAHFAVQIGLLVMMFSALSLLSRVSFGPELGDILTIPGNVVIGPADFLADGVLTSGVHCQIGVGVEADTGGSMMVVGRSDKGDIIASWASAGRSVRNGTDCGPHDIKLSLHSYLMLHQSARARSVDTTPAASGH